MHCLLLTYFVQAFIGNHAITICDKNNVCILKTFVIHQANGLLYRALEVCAAAEEELGGVHFILYGVLTRQEQVYLAAIMGGKMDQRKLAAVAGGDVQQSKCHGLTPGGGIASGGPGLVQAALLALFVLLAFAGRASTQKNS